LAGDFAPRTPLNRPWFGGFSSCSSSSPRGPKSAIPFDCGRFSSIPLRERLPRGNSAILEVSPQSVGVNWEIGRWEVEGWPAARFSGQCGLTAIGGGLTALGHPDGGFDFAEFSSVSLFALIRGAFRWNLG
jgi:hypothetical protein